MAWVNAQPGPGYIKASIMANSADKSVPVEQIRFVIHASHGDMAVPIEADGRLTVPINGDLITNNPVVEFTQHVKLSVSIVSSAPAQQSFDYGLLLTMADNYFDVVSRQDFLPSEFKYLRVKGLAIEPMSGEALDVVSTCGLRIKRDGTNYILPYDKDTDRGCHIALSRMPKSLTLSFKRF
ncbi:hypothetical protein HY57_02035 [Dyella japonica A8]|uniref:Uncharacterized protein n=1 Tax=Dyella japonica A8 TaxID=1217721 RepID=A0A075JXD1_9GAMM|nr:hypothetical protein HY57_02035 [Dyella japonica A8]